MNTAYNGPSGSDANCLEPSVAEAATELLTELARVRAANAGLEQRVQEQAAQLTAVQTELDTFSYSVAHDLRAPLRGIAGFTRALLEDHGGTLGQDGQRLIHIVRDETHRMSQLIDGVLAFTSVGRRELDPSSIDMTELARSAFVGLVEAAPDNAPSIDVAPLPPACADRGLVRQVFTSLLDNAIKFTRGKPAPQVAVTGWTDGDFNTYRVADNGVGFDFRYVDKLFDIFQRLHSQEEFDGAGVGLALVRRIVQRHGGRAWAEGNPGVGATFYFTLPQEEARS